MWPMVMRPHPRQRDIDTRARRAGRPASASRPYPSASFPSRRRPGCADGSSSNGGREHTFHRFGSFGAFSARVGSYRCLAGVAPRGRPDQVSRHDHEATSSTQQGRRDGAIDEVPLRNGDTCHSTRRPRTGSSRSSAGATTGARSSSPRTGASETGIRSRRFSCRRKQPSSTGCSTAPRCSTSAAVATECAATPPRTARKGVVECADLGSELCTFGDQLCAPSVSAYRAHRTPACGFRTKPTPGFGTNPTPCFGGIRPPVSVESDPHRGVVVGATA